jgi:hypothetical protein
MAAPKRSRRIQDMLGDAVRKVHNDHNVYILGAGFAAEGGMPLVKDFMYRMRDAVAWLEKQGGRDRELKAMALLLEFRLKAAAAAHRVPLDVENIEELFSLASASGNKELTNALPLAIAATLDYARQTEKVLDECNPFQVGVRDQINWSPPKTWQEIPSGRQQFNSDRRAEGTQYRCPPYDLYLGIMANYFDAGAPGHRNTIVTFNYDLLIEKALTNLGISFTYGVGDDHTIYVDQPWASLSTTRSRADAIPLLKLHGSVNWASARENADMIPKLQQSFHTLDSWSETTAKVKTPPVGSLIQGLGMERLLAEDWMFVFGAYDQLRACGLNLALVPPTWQKLLTGAISRVWDRAVDELRTATRIIILGYSVPVTDQHVRYLLAAGLRDNISLRKILFVNPALNDDQGRVTLESRLFGASGLFRQELRELGVIELIGRDTRAFFADPDDRGVSFRDRIGRMLNSPDCTAENAPFWLYGLFSALGTWR